MSVESPFRGGADRPLRSQVGLIETLRYDPALGCIRAAEHLARMQMSAHALQKTFDLKFAEEGLAGIASETTLRVRMFLDAQNELTITTHPFISLAEDTVWRVAIASTQLDAHNPLLQYKTSLRQTYEAARAEFASELVDEVLLTNQHGHLCEGTITNVFVQKGETLVTPPLVDGLLRGVLRQELLDTGKAIEGTIIPQDLQQYRFFVGNSLRGLIAARLFQV